MFLAGGCQIEAQTLIGDGLGGGRTEGGYLDVALLEVGEIALERLDAGRTEEHQHVKVKLLLLLLAEVVAHGAIHHTLLVVQLLLVEHLLDVVVVYVAHRHEILFGLVLYQYW